MGLIDLVDVGLFGLVSLIVFFFFFLRLCWWMWVCASGGCLVVVWVCAGDGCGFVLVWFLWLCFFFFF